MTDLNGNTTTYTANQEGSVTSITQFDNGDGGSGSNVTETIAYGVATRTRHRSPTSTATRPPTRSIRTATS